MAEFSHWDFAQDFSGYNAAALIIGIEPSESEQVRAKVKIVADRMEQHYESAKRQVFDSCFGSNLPDDEDRRGWGYIHGLQSIRLDALYYNYIHSEDEVTLSDWLSDAEHSRFENQDFSREDIAKWLDAIGMVSQYSFARGVSTELKPPAEKPLSTRERDTLLTIIAALCKDAGYDYTKAAKTAALIQSTAAKMGASIGETTIEGHLKKIPDALATRMK